ncbi:hypothetical protein O6H91_18G016500 [Diphasiastrum complanatum]|uniref:Uncharacterized protein n=1 Tax=Diphasiastrum complanatum TaxID=34168 RepID=A0ACC2AYD1_DIPCM|nr:hypothetical protein O6H91_18G016500 [Diphasiastrum complanatum]
MGQNDLVQTVQYTRIETIGESEEGILAIGPSSQTNSCNISGKFPVYLNVYDLTPLNGYSYWFGLGIFHSGVEAHGAEYAFGAHDYPTTGVFEVEPRNCPGFVYRKTIFLGTTDLGPFEFREFIEQLAAITTGTRIICYLEIAITFQMMYA